MSLPAHTRPSVGWIVQRAYRGNSYVNTGEYAHFSSAIAHYNALEVHKGARKRLLKIKHDGSRSVILRELTRTSVPTH